MATSKTSTKIRCAGKRPPPVRLVAVHANVVTSAIDAGAFNDLVRALFQDTGHRESKRTPATPWAVHRDLERTE
jgi:hypothetical protein